MVLRNFSAGLLASFGSEIGKYLRPLLAGSIDQSFPTLQIGAWSEHLYPAGGWIVQTSFRRPPIVCDHDDPFPCPGCYLCKFEGKPVVATVSSKETQYGDHTFMRFTFFGADQDVLKRFRVYLSSISTKEEGYVRIYAGTAKGWEYIGTRSKRPLSSINLPEQDITNFMTDVHQFLDKRQWYLSRGVPHRRGYLFYGPPGTGKSSLAFALAGEIDVPIYVMVTSGKTLRDEHLSSLMTALPRRPHVLLLDDIDRMFASDNRYLSASTLLGALDGPLAGEGRILIMTTNNLDKMDQTMIRPGRIDFRLGFNLVTIDSAKAMIERCVGEVNATNMFKLVQFLNQHEISPAALQVHSISYIDSTVDELIDNLHECLRQGIWQDRPLIEEKSDADEEENED